VRFERLKGNNLKKKTEAAVRLHPRGNDPIMRRDSRPKKISYILIDKASSHSIDNIR
jgi:hypothetical protein